MLLNGYPWPASALTVEDMALLYHAREASRPRVPITQLVARAVREVYGTTEKTGAQPSPTERLAA